MLYWGISLLAVLPVMACCLIGCRSTKLIVEKESTALDHAWTERAEAFAGREELVLTWPEARAMLLERNLPLRKAAEERERAQRRIGQVYRDLLPYADLQAGFGKRLTELDGLSSRDFRMDLNAYAFFSGLFSLKRDVYAAELGYIRADLVCRLVEREKTVELYRAFLAFAQRDRAVARREALKQLWAEEPPELRRRFEPQEAGTALREEEPRIDEKLQAILTVLLNQPGRRVRPKTDEAWPTPRMHLEITHAERTGRLQRNLTAIELVGARAQVQGVRLEYWPDVSAYLTSGPLWHTTGGEPIWWSKEDLWMAADARIPIDIRGDIGRRLRDAKSDLAFLEEELALRDSALLAEFATRNKQLQQVERDLAELECDSEALREIIALENLETLMTRLPAWLQLEARREALEAQRDDIGAFFLFYDEGAWTEPSPWITSARRQTIDTNHPKGTTNDEQKR